MVSILRRHRYFSEVFFFSSWYNLHDNLLQHGRNACSVVSPLPRAFVVSPSLPVRHATLYQYIITNSTIYSFVATAKMYEPQLIHCRIYTNYDIYLRKVGPGFNHPRGCL